MRAVAAVSACLLAGGCSLLYLRRPENPYPSIKKIAVARVETTFHKDPQAGLHLAEILGGELVQFPGVDAVVGPRDLGAARDMEAIRKAAGEHGADAVITARILEWNPYYKPRVGIEIAFWPTRPGPGDAGYLLELDRSARPPGAGAAPSGPVRLVRIYDSAERRVMDRVRRYALAHGAQAGGLEPADGVLRIQDRYFRFTCYQVLRDLFGRLAAMREREGDGRERDAVPGEAWG